MTASQGNCPAGVTVRGGRGGSSQGRNNSGVSEMHYCNCGFLVDAKLTGGDVA